MKLTKIQFGKDLLEKTLHKQNLAEISKWAIEEYFDHLDEIHDDENFKGVLLRLGMMEHDSKYTLSYKVLYKLSEDLILNKKIDLKTLESQL